MKEEKQIEEMARVLRPLTLCTHCLASLNRDKKRDGGCYRPIGYECSLDRDILKYCEALYTAGYRKQSEGEWKEHPHFNFEGGYSGANYECSNCHFDDIYDLDNTNYCPNCGAKMKGGAE